MPNLAELLQAPGLEALRARLLDRARRAALERGAPEVLGWLEADGDPYRHLLENDAAVLADLAESVTGVVRSGFLEWAEGPWLDLWAASQYGLARARSVFARGTATLTADPGGGPREVQPDRLWVATPGPDPKRFLVTTGGPVAPGAPLAVALVAEHPGAAYNVPPGALSRLETPLPGVRVTADAGWLAAAGADEETDARLRARCRARWALLGRGGFTAAALEGLALEASESVTQVRVVENPRGPGSADVVVWGEGGVGSEVATDDRQDPPPWYGFEAGAVNRHLHRHRALGSSLLVYPARLVPVPVRATLRVRAAAAAGAREVAAANLAALAARTRLGGTVYRSAVADALLDEARGVLDADVAEPAGNVVLLESDAVAFAPALEVVAEEG